ncbi:Ribonuclease 3-like protein 2 [Striga hermonthica]|uniref:Ribonuclease 3-like protein 2 n=1 Tax=Striga hermonthica TaxID=68872 RepID=A0A9N7NAC9_STRHE|nr:Ribonuclease 3-like protein 2 [Striga hermonthica]
MNNYYQTMKYSDVLPMEAEDDEIQEISNMEASLSAVENILGYRFKNRKLLEDALTHPSYPDSESYQRLEFVGDAALGLAMANYFFLKYPNADQGKISLVRAANISTERLGRVAVNWKLHDYVRHNVPSLHEKVREFVMAVEGEDEAEIYGGLVKAPKILADLVESLAAAVYIDCDFDLKAMWIIFGKLLEPLVMLDVLEQQPQPVTMLFELCQKDKRRVDIKHWREGEKNIAGVYVDGAFVASASSDKKENAKLLAAKVALKGLHYEDSSTPLNDGNEFGAKQKLHELCGQKKWGKPSYKIQSEVGRAHEKKYKCSVQVEIAEGILFVEGVEKKRVKEAENSAAYLMLCGMKENNYI